MTLYITSAQRRNLLDFLQNEEGFTLNVLEGNYSLAAFVVTILRNMQHIKEFVFDRAALYENDDELIKAVQSAAVFLTGEKRFVLLYENAPRAFIDSLYKLGLYNIVTSENIDDIKADIRLAISEEGMPIKDLNLDGLKPSTEEISFTGETLKIVELTRLVESYKIQIDELKEKVEKLEKEQINKNAKVYPGIYSDKEKMEKERKAVLSVESALGITPSLAESKDSCQIKEIAPIKNIFSVFVASLVGGSVINNIATGLFAMLNFKLNIKTQLITHLDKNELKKELDERMQPFEDLIRNAEDYDENLPAIITDVTVGIKNDLVLMLGEAKEYEIGHTLDSVRKLSESGKCFLLLSDVANDKRTAVKNRVKAVTDSFDFLEYQPDLFDYKTNIKAMSEIIEVIRNTVD